MKEIIVPPGQDTSRMPFSPGVRVGNLLFLSGMAGLAEDGTLPGPDIVSQARQAFANLGRVLEAAGGTWEDVVKVTCYLTHPQRDLAGWNDVWREFFPVNPPARATVGAALLNDAWLIEIDLIAALPE
jgi:2-iminobutanoate/2-iminopropanoate deaminase